MKHKLLALFRTVIENLRQSVKRFPPTIFMATVTTVLLITSVWTNNYLIAEMLGRLAMAAALGIPLTLCITLAFERAASSRAAEYGLHALALALATAYYFLLLPELSYVAVTRYIAVSAALYLAFLAIPHSFLRPGFEMHVIRVIARFLVTALYAAVLYGGLALTLLAVYLLLEINVTGELYLTVFIIIAGIFSPCFFLAGLPARDRDMSNESYPGVLKALLVYIVLPLTLVYTAILYLYFIKILAGMQWPEGSIVHLVLWYSVVSAGVMLILRPVAVENRFAGWFATWFPRINLPAILVMFMAVSVRIRDFGITENRYFVAGLGLWVFGTMIYYSYGRHTRNVALPLSLALFAFLSVIGPWSAYALSVKSQNARFEALAARYEMVAGDALRAPVREITDEDKREIAGILEYFHRSNRLDELGLLPAGFNFDDMKQLFGFSREELWGYPYPERTGFYSVYSEIRSLDVRGYDYLLISGQLLEGVTLDSLEISYLERELRLVFEHVNEENVLYKIDLLPFVEEVVEQYREQGGYREVTADEVTFTFENEHIRVKLIFTALAGRTDPKTGIPHVNFLEFYLLLQKV